MFRFKGAPLDRARRYSRQRGLSIIQANAGSGHDGLLSLSNRQSYLKTFEKSVGYCRERDIYLRLRHHRVLEVLGHTVPQLLDFDSRLGVIEISSVSPPYVLDFAQARLDQPLQDVWPADVLRERWAYWESLFPAEHWQHVQAIFWSLGQRYGIWMEDLNPGNIRFNA